MHKVLVYCSVKLSQEKVLLGETNIAVDRDVKPQTNQTKQKSHCVSPSLWCYHNIFSAYSRVNQHFFEIWN